MVRLIDDDGRAVSGMTLGTAQLGYAYGIANTTGKPDAGAVRDILSCAVAGGITCFDTSNAYEESQRVLGAFFAARPKPAFCTKLMLETGASPAELEKQMQEQVERSLAELQVDRVDIMLLHTPLVLLEHGEAVTRLFAKLRGSGVIRRAGISLQPFSGQLEALWPVVRHEVYEVVQLPLNVMDGRLIRGGGLRRLREAGKFVFARSIFLQGLLLMPEADVQIRMEPAARWLREIRTIADDEGMSVAQLALSYVRDLEEVDSLVIGVDTAPQLAANLALMDGPRISEEGRRRVAEAMNDVPEPVINPALWDNAG